MSKDRYTEPFYATPYSLHQHHLWVTATNDEKEIFRVLQFRSAVCEMTYDNNGLMIWLQRGQACMSYTQMALEANTTVKKARGAINHFRGYERSGKKLLQLPSHVAPIFRTQQKARLGAQQKTVVDILLDGYYINEGTAKDTAKGTAKGTARAQQGHTNKEAKETKEPIKETNNSPKGEVVASSTQRLFSFDEIKKEIQGITSKDLEGWNKQYPLIDPKNFFPAMSKWILANRTQEQRKCIHRKFITDWLQKHNFQAEMEVKKEEEIQSPTTNIYLTKNREEAQKFVIRYSKLICEYQSIEVGSSHLIFKDKIKDQKIQIPFIENDFTKQMNGLKNYFTLRRENEELYA